MLRFSALWLLGFAGIVPSLGAQQLRGVVRDSALAAPLPGAVVTLLDSAGGPVARTISDAAGRFVVASLGRGVRLRAVRIGYRPRDLTLAPGTDTLEIAMIRLPPILAAVRVTDSELCPRANANGAALDLWEQAKAGLLATVVARETNPAKMRSLTYDRATTSTDERVTQQTAQISTAYSNRPFVAAADASVFARVGFMREDASGRLYTAPDADVLLDDAFAATHCFHIQAADDQHPGQIGLAFTPARGRDGLVDVNGVIWIDRLTPQLRSLDFRYTGLEPAATRVGSGGHVEFHAMQNGVAFIVRWRLRLATLVSDGRRKDFAPGLPGSRADRTELRAAELRESGGIVLDAAWPDGIVWHDSTGGLSGRVVQRRSGLSIAGAVVGFAGTDMRVSTAADGTFELAPVVPGRYTVDVTDTTLADFASPRSTRSVVDVTHGRFTSLRVELPPLADVIRDLCRDQQMPRGTSMIVGRVRLTTGEHPVGSVVARWQANFNNGSSVTVENDVARALAVNGTTQQIDLDDQGHFVVCGVARGRPIHLRYAEKERFADTTLIVPDSLLHAVEWRAVLLPPKPNLSRLPVSHWLNRSGSPLMSRIRSADVMHLVVGQSFSAAGLGLAMGLAVSPVATRLRTSLLFGVSALNPQTRWPRCASAELRGEATGLLLARFEVDQPRTKETAA
jgi:hypothetical protein